MKLIWKYYKLPETCRHAQCDIYLLGMLRSGEKLSETTGGYTVPLSYDLGAYPMSIKFQAVQVGIFEQSKWRTVSQTRAWGDLRSSIIESGQSYSPRDATYPIKDITTVMCHLLQVTPEYILVSIYSMCYILMQVTKMLCWIRIDLLVLGDDVRCHSACPPLVQVTTCRLTTPTHDINQCLPITGEALCQSHQGNIMGNAQDSVVKIHVKNAHSMSMK